MKKFSIKLLITAIFMSISMPCFAAYNNGVWVNDAKSLFLRNKAIILGINIRSFNAVDKNNNDIIEIEKGETPGYFTNAVSRLDELAALGINTIHVLPVTPAGKVKALGTAGSLYAMSDFSKLNSQLDDPDNDIDRIAGGRKDIPVSGPLQRRCAQP